VHLEAVIASKVLTIGAGDLMQTLACGHTVALTFEFKRGRMINASSAEKKQSVLKTVESHELGNTAVEVQRLL